MATYKIIAIDPEKKHVTFMLEDGIEQRVGDFPVDDAEALKAKIEEYASAYVSPKESAPAKTLVPEVSSMIGKTVTFTKKVEAEVITEEIVEKVVEPAK